VSWEPRAASEGSPAERWLASRITAIALVITALGMLARLRAADAPFLQPDEVLHVRIASAPSLADTYRESLTNAHPPLFYFLLRPWTSVARSEWALRLLPAAFGTAFLWFAWLWARAALGAPSGLIVLACLAFMPSIVVVCSELRAYALLLLLIAASLWALDRAFAAESTRRLWVFTALAGLALATHYSAVPILAGAGVYAAVRLRTERRRAPFVAAWGAGQATLVALAAFLLATHVSRLRGGPLEREVQETWLKDAFYRGEGGALRFLASRTLSLFQYFFSTRPGAAIALALFAGGVLWLAARRRPVSLLLTLPIALMAAGGLLAAYPYGGTRHDAALALSAYAGTGVGLARLTGERVWAALAVAGALVASGFLVSG
jgi:Dolichyl-phosphate-mannose-protein mannosyltransferase